MPPQNSLIINRFKNRPFLLTLTAGLLPTFFVLIVLVNAETSGYLTALILIITVTIVLVCAFKIQSYSTWHLGTVSNMIEALVNGDYTLRTITVDENDLFGELQLQINLLAETLSEQSLQTRENQLLLDIIINQIDAAILSIDDDGILSMANQAASQFFGFSIDSASGNPLKDIGLAFLKDAQHQQVLEVETGRFIGKYYCFISHFMAKGKPHRLIIIGDINRLLQKEEREAWQHLLRVLSHEINNSLAPIASISNTLKKSLNSEMNGDFHKDMEEGLDVIGERARTLNTFIQRYRDLTQLPEPQKEMVDLDIIISKLMSLFHSRTIEFPQKPLKTFVDPQQIEQLLLNLLQNADEAMTNKNGKISIDYQTFADRAVITISDEGEGISNPQNLFVPFYTTKEEGSGIGLVLARQIAFHHGGQLQLINRDDRNGAIAILSLPYYHMDSNSKNLQEKGASGEEKI